MLKYSNKRVIEVSEWNDLVKETYSRPYDLQQQDGCKDRGTVNLTIPSESTNDEEMNDSIPKVVNGEEMGVKFNVWLARDPKQPLPAPNDREYCIGLFWNRNFYPDLQTVANNLYSKGLIEAGDYTINIDW